ncbi:prolyl-tRNA synthetase associated domain-containing protein [Cognatishimia sp.]|uniref:prolyl-tRNA synthetase associated domain-containing protein n=1 Tax=Cognatishimia sp. TaxID=2211648 RepID=UPI0035128E51|nr:prolyl-tRNA synthetase associated domain-containing protein [Cognatishimia sp.]
MDASSAFQDSLPVSSDALLALFQEWGIDYRLFHHVPLRTVADAKEVERDMMAEGETAFLTKNLYLRDRKKRNYLVTLDQDRDVDLKALGKALGVGGLSFGSADRLLENLGIRPGAVSPLSMINGAKAGVTFILDQAARDADVLFFHPLVNDRTVAITLADLEVIFGHYGAEITWLPDL